MPPFDERLADDLKSAMKARDTTALNTLRALKTALTNARIEKGGPGAALDDAETLAVVRRQLKQRDDSIAQFEQAGRDELAANERAEAAILARYLPAAMDEQELAAVVGQAIAETGATGKADMGKVMKRAQELAAGRADGKTLSAAVMKRLG